MRRPPPSHATPSMRHHRASRGRRQERLVVLESPRPPGLDRSWTRPTRLIPRQSVRVRRSDLATSPTGLQPARSNHRSCPGARPPYRFRQSLRRGAHRSNVRIRRESRGRENDLEAPARRGPDASPLAGAYHLRRSRRVGQRHAAEGRSASRVRLAYHLTRMLHAAVKDGRLPRNPAIGAEPAEAGTNAATLSAS